MLFVVCGLISFTLSCSIDTRGLRSELGIKHGAIEALSYPDQRSLFPGMPAWPGTQHKRMSYPAGAGEFIQLSLQQLQDTKTHPLRTLFHSTFVIGLHGSGFPSFPIFAERQMEENN